MPNTSRSTKKIKKVKFDKKQCFPGPNDIIVNKEECKTINNKDCGKKVYLENGKYYYCRNYRPIIGKRGCDYLSTTNKRQGLCNNQELIKKVLSRNRGVASTASSSQSNQFITNSQSELVSRLTELKKLGYNKKMFDEVLSPLAENAQFLTTKQRNDLKSKLLVEAIDEEVTNKKAEKELKKLQDKYFEIEMKKRLQTLKQGGKRKSKKSKKHKPRKHKYGGSRSPSRSRSRSPSRSPSRSRSRSRSRSPRSLSPSTRKTKKIRGFYTSPVKREPKTHVIFEGEDEFNRREEILNSPSTFVGDKISFFGNNQFNQWSGDIVLIDGKKTLVNVQNPYDY